MSQSVCILVQTILPPTQSPNQQQKHLTTYNIQPGLTQPFPTIFQQAKKHKWQVIRKPNEVYPMSLLYSFFLLLFVQCVILCDLIPNHATIKYNHLFYNLDKQTEAISNIRLTAFYTVQ